MLVFTSLPKPISYNSQTNDSDFIKTSSTRRRFLRSAGAVVTLPALEFIGSTRCSSTVVGGLSGRPVYTNKVTSSSLCENILFAPRYSCLYGRIR